MKIEKIGNLIIKDKRKIYTKSKEKFTWYDEKIIKEKNQFLREWNPKKSKIAAAIRKGLRYDFTDKEILYLGCSTGTTVSHLADLTNKIIIGVDISPFTMRDFLLLTYKKENVLPLYLDANELPNFNLNKKFDLIFADIATRNMTDIFIKNIKKYLKKNGEAWISLKTRSINSTISAKKVLDQEIGKLKKAKIKIKNIYSLEPFEKEHYFITVKYE